MKKDFIPVNRLSNHIGSQVYIRGWIYNKRSSGKLIFIIFRDGTGTVQAVAFKPNLKESLFEELKHLTDESSIVIKGVVKSDSRAPSGVEIDLTDAEVLQSAQTPFPIALKDHGVDFLFEWRHLWMRFPKEAAIMRIRHRVIKSARDYFDNNGFTLVDSPILTGNSCEGTTNLFELDYFDNKAYLSQSGQLYLEAAASALGKVYCCGPVFRAEKSKTRRHLTEFWMIEPEVAFMDLNQDMDLAEDFISYIVSQVIMHNESDLKMLDRDISKLEKIKKPFPRITYDQACDILIEAGEKFNRGDDFGGKHETIISSSFDKPVIIHRYPSQIKPFYMKSDPQDISKSLCMDVIASEGYGEIIGGGQREDDNQELMKKIHKDSINPELINWYIDVRKYGSVPHAGFGLGIERTVAWICGIHHVRQAIPFARTLNRIYP